jgi:competence protein ComEC
LTLRLKSPRAPVNFHGPDRELWYFAEGIAAMGTVEQGRRLGPEAGWRWTVARWREAVRARMLSRDDRFAERAVLAALAVADRSALSREQRERFAITGTGHLIAISGLHVGLAAAIGFWLARGVLALCWFMFSARQALIFAWLASLATAGLYAAMAGFGVSTQRALIMLAVVAAARILGRHTRPWAPLTWALAIVLSLDPLAPLRPGFWFSFMAVGALLLRFGGRQGRSAWPSALVQAQIVASLIAIPTTAFWFQSVSQTAMPANLFAVPWVSLVVVPATFVAVAAMALSSGAFDSVLDAALSSVAVLDWVLDRFATMGNGLRTVIRPLTLVTAAALSTLVYTVITPRLIRFRALALLPLVILSMPLDRRQKTDAFDIEVLDVGQGLSVIVDTAAGSMLYDTGPGLPGQWDLVDAVVAPALGARPVPPDPIIASHGDLDHAGGLASLRRRYPEAQWLLNVGPPAGELHDPDPVNEGLTACSAGRRWEKGGVFFEVLHPNAALPYLGNDSSCVLRVAGLGGSLLLPGDVGRSVEQRLYMEGIAAHDILLVPHHGSRTSSSDALLDRVAPRLAVASVGFGNRFGMPHGEVVERYARRGVPLLTTADCGAIRIRVDRRGPGRASSARRARQGVWRWPAASHCP